MRQFNPLPTMNPETEDLEIPTADFHNKETALGNWFELVEPLDVPTPETHKLELNHDVEGPPEWNTQEAISLVEQLGGEAFVRSDFKSASHNLTEGSYIHEASEEATERTLTSLLSQHVMMQMPLGKNIYLREWLDLDWHGYARDTCHPEVRFFIRNGEVTCYHLRSDFRNQEHLKDKARAFFDKTNSDYPTLTETVHEYAQTVAEAVSDEAWYSVDFVLTRDYDWYLTDMALNAVYERDGEYQNISAHPGDCKHDLEKRLSQSN